MNKPPRVVLFGILPVLAFGSVAPAIALYSKPVLPDLPRIAAAYSVMFCAAVSAIWLLDSIGFVRFRYEWVSKAVWRTAIASLLLTGISIYRTEPDLAARGDASELEGQWLITLSRPTEGYILNRVPVLLWYSPTSKAYFGYSGTVRDAVVGVHAVELVELNPERKTLELVLHASDDTKIRASEFVLAPDRRSISATSGLTGSRSEFLVTLNRPN